MPSSLPLLPFPHQPASFSAAIRGLRLHVAAGVRSVAAALLLTAACVPATSARAAAPQPLAAPASFAAQTGANPTARITPPGSTTVGTQVTFSAANSSDPQNQPLSFAWDFNDGSLGKGVTAQHAFTASGRTIVTLTVTTADGRSAQANASIIVTAAQNPKANAGGPYSAVAGSPLQLDGSGSSDPRNSALSYSWNFGDGSSGASVNPQHTYTTTGTYQVALTVTNAAGRTSSASTTASITAANPAPTARIVAPASAAAGVPVVFDGSTSSDPQGEPLTYLWTFRRGSSSSQAKPSYTFAGPGSYTVILQVTNKDGLSGKTTFNITITTPPSPTPVPNAGGPYSGAINTAIAFNGYQSCAHRPHCRARQRGRRRACRF